MVAYSFKRQFADPIVAGTKRQTIRADRKRHARPGEEVQLYSGMRTRQCKLIGRSICIAAAPVRLSFVGRNVEIEGETVIIGRQLRDAFARADGFDDWDGLREFWRENHPDTPVFSGVLIRWGDLL